MIPRQPESVSFLMSLGAIVVGLGLMTHALWAGRRKRK